MGEKGGKGRDRGGLFHEVRKREGRGERVCVYIQKGVESGIAKLPLFEINEITFVNQKYEIEAILNEWQ